MLKSYESAEAAAAAADRESFSKRMSKYLKFYLISVEWSTPQNENTKRSEARWMATMCVCGCVCVSQFFNWNEKWKRMQSVFVCIIVSRLKAYAKRVPGWCSGFISILLLACVANFLPLGGPKTRQGFRDTGLSSFRPKLASSAIVNVVVVITIDVIS